MWYRKGQRLGIRPVSGVFFWHVFNFFFQWIQNDFKDSRTRPDLADWVLLGYISWSARHLFLKFRLLQWSRVNRMNAQRLDRRQLPPKLKYKGTAIEMLSRWRTDWATSKGGTKDRLSLVWGPILRYVGSEVRTGEKTICPYLVPSMQLFVIRRILDSMTVMTTDPGDP